MVSKYIVSFILVLLVRANVFATWSIILVDSLTGAIGIAGASCTKNCYGIGEIIPGKGAIVVQAMSHGEARAKGIQMILSNYSPQDIIIALRTSYYDPERQQYAVVTLKHFGMPMTYTGDSTKFFRGTLVGRGVSVQGNTLMNEQVLEKIFNTVIEGRQRKLPLDELLMLALIAGSDAGGDRRCGEQAATSAFITVARPTDKRPYLNLLIFGQTRGGPNAVTMLSQKYERWKNKRSKKV